MKSTYIASFALLTALLTTPYMHAQPPMADHVPAEVMLYVGWSGLDAVEDELAKSPLKQMWSDTHAAHVIAHVESLVTTYVAAQNHAAAKQIQLLYRIALGLRDYPTGFYFAGLSHDKGGLRYPLLAFISDVGDDADAVVKRLSFVNQMGIDLNLPIRVLNRNGVVKVTIGDIQPHANSLAQLPQFQHLLERESFTPLVWVYVDVARMPQIIEQGAQMVPELAAKLAERWRTVKRSLHLDQVKGFLWSAGFQDGQWVTRAFLAAPAPRTGWLSAVETQPIDDRLLRTVPHGASITGGLQANAKVVAPILLDILQELDSAAAARLHQGTELAKQVLGADPQAKMIASIDDPWVYYCDANVGGSDITGMVAINSLRDPVGFTIWLEPALQMLSQPAGGEGDAEGIRVIRMRLDDMNAWQIRAKGITIALAVVDEFLVVSRAVDTVVLASRFIRNNEASILDNHDFNAMRKRLGASRAGAIWYSELRQGGGWLRFVNSLTSDVYGRIAIRVGVTMPSLPDYWSFVAKYLGATGAFVWTDEQGWHLATSSPFFGAAVIAHPAALLLAPATLVAEPVIDGLGQPE